MIYTKLEINGTEFTDAKNIRVEKTIGDFNATSNFSADFDNFAGRHKTDFNLSDEVTIRTNTTSFGNVDSEELKTGEDTDAGISDTQWKSQTFTVGTVGEAIDFNITNIKIKAYRFGSPGTCTVSIKATSGGEPSGDDLSTGTFDGDSITTSSSGEWIDVSMSDYTLENGVTYAIVIRSSESVPTVVNWLCDTDEGYAGGTGYQSADSGDSWASLSLDFLFEVDGEINGTKIFTGLIEDINFQGEGVKEVVRIKGRDFGAFLQDIIVQPRVFKNEETSQIVLDIMEQNISSNEISINNVNTTTKTIDKITFANISVFDALQQLAEIAEFVFYVDEDKDLHFEQKEGTDSGITIDNTNTEMGVFKNSDKEIFNKITVYGDRILTGTEDIFTSDGGSVFNLSYKPHNTKMYLSGATDTIYEPAGVVNLNDPAEDNVKYLVDFQGQQIVFASGIIAGDNIPPTGSVIIARYDRNTPIISIKADQDSQLKYKLKEKVIVDQKIKDPDEASVLAVSKLNEFKDPRIQGDVQVKGVLNVTPGNTVTVDFPYNNINSQAYAILSARYDFSPMKVNNEDVLSLTLNKKLSDFTDTMKNQMLRMKQIEISQLDPGIVTLQSNTGSLGVSGTNIVVKRSIGSAFYFHIPNHDILNSPSSLLGDMRTGSTVFENGVEI